MKIPESVRIAGVEYKITEIPNLTHGNALAYAHIVFDNTEIEFCSTIKVSHEHRCVTLWHEILHGITEHYEITLDADNEEEIVRKFARGIYQVLQDNGRRLFDLVDPTNPCTRGCQWHGPEGCVLECDMRPCGGTTSALRATPPPEENWTAGGGGNGHSN